MPLAEAERTEQAENYFDHELEQLRMFYILGPERKFRLKKEFGLDSVFINQDELRRPDGADERLKYYSMTRLPVSNALALLNN